MFSVFFNKLFRFKNRGVALFLSVLMSLSLALVAVVSMSRFTQSAQLTGSSMKERKLLLYAQSAANLVMASLQDSINEKIDPESVYYFPASGVSDNYVFYPADINVTAKKTVFGFRAKAVKFAGTGNTPPGSAAVLDDNNYCYDITIDVVEILELPSGSTVGASSDVRIGVSTRYFFGEMKTIGVLSCFQKGAE